MQVPRRRKSLEDRCYRCLAHVRFRVIFLLCIFFASLVALHQGFASRVLDIVERSVVVFSRKGG